MKPRFSVALIHADPCSDPCKNRRRLPVIHVIHVIHESSQFLLYACVRVRARVRGVVCDVLSYTQYLFFLLGSLGSLGSALDRLRFSVIHVESPCVDHMDHGLAAGPSRSGALRGGAEVRPVAQ